MVPKNNLDYETIFSVTMAEREVEKLYCYDSCIRNIRDTHRASAKFCGRYQYTALHQQHVIK